MGPTGLRSAILLTFLAGSPLAAQPSTTDTRLLAQPAVSPSHIAFMYAGDLWTARLDGSDVQRLTTADGDESNAVFSPDGKWIAFAGNYDGNTDAYVMPASGGEPRRLTWHPGNDIPQAFAPDGSHLLFISSRADFSGRYGHLWTVPVGGGPETRLPIPNAAQASYSPDGRSIAYNPLNRAFEQWKGYRGGTASQVWIIDTRTWDVEKVPQPAGRSNDVDPMWLESNVLWFRSDREGEFNLYKYDRRSKAVTRVTNHTDFPILAASAGGGKIGYEQAGRLHLLDPATGQSRRLAIGVAADLREPRPRWVKGQDFVRNVSISPSGARVAFEMRGEIVTVPAEKGDARNLTNTTGTHERDPAWSPDGRQVAYVSDQGGEYRVHIAPQDRKGEPRVIEVHDAGFLFGLAWSPDGKRIAYRDNSQTIWVLDVATGECRKVAANRVYTPLIGLTYSWSPDSRWLAYTVQTQPLVSTLALYDVQQDKSTFVTDGLSEVTQPVFERNGKYLYVLASTDAGPALDWFALSNAGLRRTRAIYAIALTRDAPNPFVRESDEEKGIAAKPDSAKPIGGSSAAPAAGTGGATGSSAPRGASQSAGMVDFAGIAQRIVAFPVAPAEIELLAVGEASQVFYLRRADGRGTIRRYDITKRKDDVVVPEANGFQLTNDGKKILYRTTGTNWFLQPVATFKAGEGRLDLATVDLRIDPRAEWPQIFDEAWRINRDYFYATNYHGVDWDAQRKKYAEFLPHATTRGDVARVIRWMLSELRVGHSYQNPGQRLGQPPRVGVGLLGADYDVTGGRYRFARIYGGLNWNPTLRAPLTEPGVDVRVGEYLLKVEGVELRPPTNIYDPFENTVGKSVEITVGPNPDGTGSRTVTVVPIAAEGGLRNRAWIEGNIRKVDSATGGRVAYVYVPNTGGAGYESFKRYFYPQAHKDAIIVDERFNGGGSLADYYIDILQRPALSWWAMRYGEDLKTPTASIQGPKALLIDETAGSGGDYFPWMFRQLKIGPLIGQRTWGGLVGILGFPVLMDGGSITAPNLAIWVPAGGFIVENEGVAPDLEVEQTPKEVIAGRDPQLERAIAWVTEELRKNPPVNPKRPPFPDKTKRP
ncbi:MAG TPA: PDZ domain-containing protein [Gemmatimonadales bacterium]|nr:PDZ domain-containing protein [Gemmatimonadales bacterium]